MQSPKPCSKAAPAGAPPARLVLALLLVLSLAGCASAPPPEPAAPAAPGETEHAAFAAAVAELREQRYQAAAERLDALTRAWPRLATPWANLGVAYAGLGREGEAAQAWQRALELAPGEPVAANRLALVHRQAGRFQEARALYEAALAAHPEHAASHLNLGILCDLYLQDLACALAGYERFLALSGEDAKVSGWIVDLKRRLPAAEDGS